jgi:hypothetical protein
MAANRIKQTEIHVSPKVGDIVFYEYCDTVLPINQNPAYGSAHPNPVKYPNHKLSFIDAADDEGRVKWYYVADRTEQEEYNWRESYPYVGLTNCPRFTCTSVVPRADFTPTAKGTAHPLDLGEETPDEHERFIGAKLVFEQQMEIGFKEIESLYIAVQRIYDKVPTVAEQLTHKIETTYPYAGLVACPRRTRTLVISRAEFTGTAKGTVDPVFSSAKLIQEEQVESGDQVIENLYVIVRRVYDEVPTIAEQEAYNSEREFPYQSNANFPRTTRKYVVPRADADTATIPSSGLNLGGATLAFRRVDRFEGQPEDSLYVMVTVAHDRIPNLATTTPVDEAAFLKGFGYTITRPYGTDDHPRLTWRIPMVKAGFTLTPEYTACPVTGYTALKLTDEQVETDPNNASNLTLVRVYDTLPGPTLENLSIDRNNDIPNQFVSKRTLERTRIPVQNDATPDTVAGSPLDLNGTLIRASVGADGSNQVIYSKGADKLKLEIAALERWELDPTTGGLIQITQEVVPAGTAGAAMHPTTGVYSEIDPVNPFWSIKTTRKATDLGSGADAISYQSVVDYSWPAVLLNLPDFDGVISKAGHLVRLLYDVNLREGYSGPCRALITESWTATPVSYGAPIAMQPTEIKFNFPLTGLFEIPACLHPAITLTETIGSSHPTLAQTNTVITFAATNYTDWPSSIIASAVQTPYRGGYSQKQVLVYKPGT